MDVVKRCQRSDSGIKKCVKITNKVNLLYAICQRKFNIKLIFVSLFLEMFREVVKSGFAIFIFAVKINLEGLCLSHDEIDDF